MQSDSSLAFMLHRKPYRETSALVYLFSQTHGRLSCVAKGVQRPKSQWRGLLQPFVPIQISFSGRGELKNLTQVDAAGIPYSLSGTRSFCALYVNELLSRCLLNDEAMPLVFDAYVKTLTALRDQDLEKTLREFEWCLLDEMGYGIDFLHDAQTGAAIESAQMYQFQVEYGFTQQDAVFNQTVTFSGEVILRLQQHCWDVETLSAAKQIFRVALKSIIGDKPLKSKALFRTSHL